jgi:hypothetical protein
MFYCIKRIPFNDKITNEIFYAYYITPEPKDDVLLKITKLQRPGKLSGFHNHHSRDCLFMTYNNITNEIIKNDDIMWLINYLMENNYKIHYEFSTMMQPYLSSNPPNNDKFCIAFTKH